MKSLSEYSARKQESCGLPVEPLYDHRILFDVPSNSMVLSVNLRRRRLDFPQLFYRPANVQVYRAVADLIAPLVPVEADQLAFGSPVIGRSKLVCVVSSYDFLASEKAVPIDAIGLGRIDLSDGSGEFWDTRSFASAWFPGELLATDDSDEEIYARLGARNSDDGTVSYCVGRIRWKSEAVEEVSPMPNVFF